MLLLADATYTLTFSYNCCASSPAGILDNISLVKYTNVNDIDTGIVTNGDFVGPNGWTYSGNAYHVMDWGITNTQLGATWFDNIPGTAISQQISDVPETAIYRLSFNCRGTKPNQPGWINITYTITSTDGRVAPFSGTGSCDSQWATYTADLLLLADATYTLTFSYSCCSTSPTKGILDNVSLVKQADVDDLDTGLITNGEFIGPNSWTYNYAYHKMEEGPTGTQLGVTYLLGNNGLPSAPSIVQNVTVPLTETYPLSFNCRSATSGGASFVYKLESSNPNTPPIQSLIVDCAKNNQPWTAHIFNHGNYSGRCWIR